MPEKQRNLYSDVFEAAFLAEQIARGVDDPTPYFRQKHDYIKLAELTEVAREANWPLSLERWTRAVEHYFMSEVGCYRSIAHLSSRFSAFYKAPLNKYGEPLDAPQSANKSKNARALEMMRNRYAGERPATDGSGTGLSKVPHRGGFSNGGR